MRIEAQRQRTDGLVWGKARFELRVLVMKPNTPSSLGLGTTAIDHCQRVLLILCHVLGLVWLTNRLLGFPFCCIQEQKWNV
jgi:hypothetical protein